MPEYPLLPEEAVSRKLYWLLTLTWSGCTYRWATDHVDITDEDGEVLHYGGGLRLTFTESMNLGKGQAIPAVGVRDLIFPINVAEEIEHGHPLYRAPVEIALWPEGRPWEHRIVYLRGKLTLADYGASDQPVSFTVVPDGFDGGIIVPTPNEVIDDHAWTAAAEESFGQSYPIVIGKPGFTVASSRGINAGSPVFPIDTGGGLTDALVAGHPVVATSVDIHEIEATAEASRTVSTTEDGRGQQTATVTLGGLVAYTAGNTYWARWNDTDGGMENPWESGVALRGLGDVIRWALGRTGILADTGRWLSVRDELSAYKVDTYIDRPTDLWAWVNKVLLPMAPITLLTGPAGIFPVVWDPAALDCEGEAIDAEAMGLERVGPVRFDDANWFNALRVRFAPRSDNGKLYKYVALVGGEPEGDPDEISNVYTRSSQTAYGVKTAKPLDLPAVYDEATAQLAATWRSIAFSRPWRTVEYKDVKARFAWLRPTRAIRFTSAELHMDDKTAWVASVKWDSTVPTFTFLIIDDIVRDSRA